MVISNVYMYVSGRNGDFKEYFGSVYVPQNILNSYFISNSGKRTKCSYDEGDPSNNCVWYRKPNKKMALLKLIDYEKKFIKRYETRFEKHKDKHRKLQYELEKDGLL